VKIMPVFVVLIFCCIVLLMVALGIVFDALVIRPILQLFGHDDDGIKTSRDW